MPWTWPEFDSIDAILRWLRPRYFRYDIHEVESLLAFVQGYSLARRLQYPAFAEQLLDSSQEFFEMDGKLLPMLAVRRHSPSKTCDVSIFYAWLDWLSNESTRAAAAAELTADVRKRFDNEQRRFHRNDEAAIIPSPHRILIVDNADGTVRLLMLDDGERIYFEMPAKSVPYAKSQAQHFADCEFDWVAVDKSLRYGTRGRLFNSDIDSS
ncbi:MAG TPA: hypothetical protein VJ724_11295 [Tahibacter sp.]|nr:hypothetical protein [Tahibacter sp.]